jgi:hypothetical protein
VYTSDACVVARFEWQFAAIREETISDPGETTSPVRLPGLRLARLQVS